MEVISQDLKFSKTQKKVYRFCPQGGGWGRGTDGERERTKERENEG